MEYLLIGAKGFPVEIMVDAVFVLREPEGDSLFAIKESLEFKPFDFDIDQRVWSEYLTKTSWYGALMYKEEV